ncbi:MAG TPA: ABC transporter substrate-binding protein [Candidatus Paceibacterota bacterium]
MSKHAKIILGILVVAALFVWGVVSQKNVSDMSVIQIGLMAPLSGNVAFLGEGIRDAAIMAERELNARPESKYAYEVIVEDDAFDVKKTASAVQKLVSIDRVSALISLASAAGNVVNPVAERNHIVHFGIASDPNVANGDYNFVHWTPPAEEAKVFVSELKRRGYKKVAILGANIQGVAAVAEAVIQETNGTDVSVVNNQVFDFGTKDFRTMIVKAETTRPDIYLLLAFSPELEIMTGQIRDLGVKASVTSIESFEQSDRPQMYEGLWYVNAADSTNEFNEAYKSLYGRVPSLGAGNAYDIVHLIATAAEKVSGNPTPDKIAEKLYEIRGERGALGELSVGPEGLVRSKAVVREIRDGKPVTIGK